MTLYSGAFRFTRILTAICTGVAKDRLLTLLQWVETAVIGEDYTARTTPQRWPTERLQRPRFHKEPPPLLAFPPSSALRLW